MARKLKIDGHLGVKDVEAVYRLWDELASIQGESPDAALIHLLETLAKWTGAGNAQWFGAVRVVRGAAAKHDPMRGWRLRAEHLLVSNEAFINKPISWLFERNKRRDLSTFDLDLYIGMATRTLVANAGKFQVHRLRDGWIDFEAFRRTAHFRCHYEEIGITDRIWVFFPLNADTESGFVFDRCHTRRRFSERDAALVGMVLRGIREFHRRLFLGHGLHIGDNPLTPLQRRIVRGLLTEKSEKEIAAEMGQQPRTLHKYITSLYARFGVKGRAGLMSMWLGH